MTETGTCEPICDDNQCQNGNFECQENSSCSDLCENYECVCDDGFSLDEYGSCVQQCDEDQCANPLIAMLSCPVFSDCIDKCDGNCNKIGIFVTDKNIILTLLLYGRVSANQ